MQKMLYQECRPESIDDYVFVDKDMKTKFKEWITEKYLPETILSGPPGTGKCLAGNECIDVEINTEELSEEMLQKLEKYRI